MAGQPGMRHTHTYVRVPENCTTFYKSTPTEILEYIGESCLNKRNTAFGTAESAEWGAPSSQTPTCHVAEWLGLLKREIHKSSSNFKQKYSFKMTVVGHLGRRET